MTESKYTRTNSDSAICHMFEKILKLKKLMLTNSGKDEAKSRHENTVNFMRIYFNEENAYDWLDFLDSFLKEEYNEIEN